MTTVDRQRWLRQRIAFLEGELAGADVADDQRAAIEAELTALRAEQGWGGRSRLLRWLGGVHLPGRG